MSLIQMRLFSEALNMFTPVNVILPQPRDAHRELQPLPTPVSYTHLRAHETR